MQSGDEWSQIAFVTFKDTQGAETALLLSGATIVDLDVIITPAPEYQLPPSAILPPLYNDSQPTKNTETPIQKAEEVVSSMLAKGFILGKDTINKAKSFDQKHQLTSTASSKISSFDKMIGLSEKVTTGTSAVGNKAKEMDQKFQVSEKTKSAFAAAEQKMSSAGSAIMKNRYVFTGASWATGAFSKVSKAASDVGSNAKEKAVAEETQRKRMEEEFAQVHLK
ncbi:binding partner of ACD11 1-like isoform X2 [Asparagus officinalis]|nr:binding partner of ACD11 1-like isoform X2 [Asparagus officinalis]XP_020248392.1 binding partner of ACD11 1-like isoform X2 [Asparagus officinalis]